LAPLVRRTWAPRGQTPILYQPGRHHGKVSVIAALTVPPRRQRVGLYFSLYAEKNVNAERVLRFLRALRRQLQKIIFVVWDRSQTHKAKIVNRFFERSRTIHRFSFPSYAPELNPTEMVWGNLKGNPLANLSPETSQELSRRTRYHASRLRCRKSLLRSFLRATPLFSRLN
jgi:transposase